MRRAAAVRRTDAGADDPAPAPGRPDRLVTAAGLGLIALAVLALGVYALRWHRVGDTAAETDFYSGYAFGARQLQHGRLDFGRYGVFGPVFEVLLALAGLLVRDLFTAARLLSVVATGATLFAWWAIARNRLGATAALALAALMLVDPTFVRYGYSATTDATAFALFSLSAWLTFVPPARGRLAAAGALAGLATLTRYNLATLIPAGLLLLALGASAPPRRRRAAIVEYLAGALIVLLPWTLASLAAGHVPGITLLRDRGYYGAADPAQVLENRYRDIEAGIGTQPAAPAGGSLAAFATGVWHGFLPHLRHDATDLLGLPCAALAALGLVVALARRRLGAFAPWLPLALLTLLPLLPVYYSLRYSMVLLPFELLPAAWLVAAVAGAPWPRRAGPIAAAALALAVLVPTARWSAAQHAEWLADLPLESRTAGEAILARVHAGSRMIARKAHPAYYAGLAPVPFPLVAQLSTLAGFCRAQDVRYLYYSGIEARARPAFAFLLDTSATVPGLAVLYASEAPPAIVYAIGAGFGETPPWWGDASVRRRVEARVNVLLEPGAISEPYYLHLAEADLERGRPAVALRDAEAAARFAPADLDARRLEAEALRQLGARDAAIETLQAALLLAPQDIPSRLGLGLLLREAGRNAEAGEAWLPLMDQTRDPALLAAMDSLYTALGDARTAARARAALAAVRRAATGRTRR